MKPLYTASALERVMECPASVHLPQVWRGSKDSERGTSIHAFVQRCLSGVPVADSLALVEPGLVDLCGAIDLRKVGGDLRDVRAEVAYGYDTRIRSAYFLGVNIGRNYDVGESVVPGTNDFEGVRFDDVQVVGDLKTGDPLARCSELPQMKFHALVRRQVTRAREVQARVVYIGRDGGVNIDAHTFDRSALDDFEDELEECEIAVQDARDEITERGFTTVSKGEWCKYCPAMQACPAYVGLARRQIADLDAFKVRLDVLTPEERGAAWVLAKQAETLAEVILDGLKACAKQEPFPLPEEFGGGIVKAITFPRDDFNKMAAIKLLREKGATSADIAALYTEHSVTQVRKMGKPGVRKTKAKALPGAAPQLVASPDDEAVA